MGARKGLCVEVPMLLSSWGSQAKTRGEGVLGGKNREMPSGDLLWLAAENGEDRGVRGGQR